MTILVIEITFVRSEIKTVIATEMRQSKFKIVSSNIIQAQYDALGKQNWFNGMLRR